MGKKRKFERNIPDAAKFIGNLRYKDMKKECVIRGMEFDILLGASIPFLSNWLMANFRNTPHFELLNVFDDYQENLIREALIKKGENPENYIHPSLRLGYIAERDEEGNVTKRKRVTTIFKKKKTRRERTDDGIFKGTKKAYTFELQQQGKTKAEVINEVMKLFPDASEKSIGIWFNKSRKSHKS